jgi:hypothetical protein
MISIIAHTTSKESEKTPKYTTHSKQLNALRIISQSRHSRLSVPQQTQKTRDSFAVFGNPKLNLRMVGIISLLLIESIHPHVPFLKCLKKNVV